MERTENRKNDSNSILQLIAVLQKAKKKSNNNNNRTHAEKRLIIIRVITVKGEKKKTE